MYRANLDRLSADDSKVEAQSEFYTAFDETDHVRAVDEAQERKLRALANSPDLYDLLVRSMGKWLVLSRCCSSAGLITRYCELSLLLAIEKADVIVSVACAAPSVYQMEDVKKGILCQLFGGTNSNSSVRS